MGCLSESAVHLGGYELRVEENTKYPKQVVHMNVICSVLEDVYTPLKLMPNPIVCTKGDALPTYQGDCSRKSLPTEQEWVGVWNSSDWMNSTVFLQCRERLHHRFSEFIIRY